MKTKVCPCCDQPMTGIYCKGCRKIVLNPVEQNIQYYLNTRHPDYDHDCTFHDDGVGSSSALTRKKSSNTPAGKRSLTTRAMYGSEGSGGVRRSDRAMSASETEARKALIVATITVIVTFLIVFLFLMIATINTMDGVTRMGAAVAIPEPVAAPVEVEEAWANRLTTENVTLEAPAPGNNTPEAPAPEDDTLEIPSIEIELPTPRETDVAQMEEWELTDAEVREAGVDFFETALKNQGEGGFCVQNGLEVVCYTPETDEEYGLYEMAIYAPGYYMVQE